MYNVNQDILWESYLISQRLNKLEKIIEFLKEQFEITLDSKLRISDGTDCIQAFPLLMKSNEVIYDLLKEVLIDER